MKRPLIVTGVILGVAFGFGMKEERRLMEAEKRLEEESRRVAEWQAGEETRKREAEQRSRSEKVEASRRSGEELIQWVKEVQEKEKREGKREEEVTFEMYERLEGITLLEAGWIMREYLNGKGVGGVEGTLLFRTCMMKLAKDAPEMAVEIFGRFRKQWKDWQILREVGPQIIGDSVVAMAKSDPDKAVEWLRTKGKDFDVQITELTKRMMLFHVGRKDPVKAFGLIDELGMEQRDMAVSAIIRAALTDEERVRMLEAFKVYGQTLPDGPMKAEVLGTAFATIGALLAEEGPGMVKSWVTMGNPAQEEVDAIAAGIVDARNLRDHEKWIGWIGGAMSPEKADGAVRKLFSSWTESDYGAAGKWLVAQPPGAVREMAVQAYAETAAKYDPVTAGEWAESLPAGERREETLRRVYEDWPEEVEGREAFGRRNGL